jgi:type 1 glutamine amidotransferase
MIWTVTYGKGRVFHTPMGHDDRSMRCLGFVGTLQRGTEWAATGKVSLPLPENFPTADKTSTLPAK